MFLSAVVLIALLFGSGLTIQLLVIPQLIKRVQDRSTLTRVSNEILRRHHMMSVLLLIPATILCLLSSKLPSGILTAAVLSLNMYQRFWLFTKLHLVKQPIGVQDLIQPDNVLREEFNKLQRMVYLVFRIHLVLLLMDLLLSLV